MEQMQAVNNIDKHPLLSNEQTINHQPDKFIIDFRHATPQFIGNEAIVVFNHRIILLDPYTAKMFLLTLKENISKYEQKFGEIKKPGSLILAEKEIDKVQKEATTTTERPSYLG